MNLAVIKLRDFRGYHETTVEFDRGLNILVGPNGAGKSNLLEAIAVLTTARSFRTNAEDELRRKGCGQAELDGRLRQSRRSLGVRVILSLKGKKVFIEGHETRKLSELVERCHAITFQPEDAFLFDAPPSERRRWLNRSVFQASEGYLKDLNRYEKILTERNNLLKQEQPDRRYLQSLTELLIESAERIVNARHDYLQRLFPIVESLVKTLSDDSLKVSFAYRPFVAVGPEFLKRAEEAYKRVEESDLKYRVTTIGPHREDFVCLLNGREIGACGSQGEKRLAALALRLAPYQLTEDEDRKPIVLLDDVLSELDEARRRRLLEVVSNYEQTIITTAEWKDEKEAAVYDIADHHITRRTHYDR